MIIGATADGVRIEADDEVAAFLVRLPDMLEHVDPDEEAARRLAPPVYLDDEEANEEWWGYMEGELTRGRSDDRKIFRSVMRSASESSGVELSREEAHALARVVTELRLVMAARLGIRTEDDYDELALEDRALLDVLAGVQMGVLTALEHDGVPE